MNGTSYGIPWYVETRLVYYRTDLAKKAGYTTPPKDWEGLKAMAKAMQDKAGAKWGIGLQAGATGLVAERHAVRVVQRRRASARTASPTASTRPEMQEAVKYYQSFFTDGISDKAAPATPDDRAGLRQRQGPDVHLRPVGDVGRREGRRQGLQGQVLRRGDADEEDRPPPSSAAPTSRSSRTPRSATPRGSSSSASPTPRRRPSGTSSRPTCPRSPAAWKDPSLSADTKLAMFGEQLEDRPGAAVLPDLGAGRRAVRQRDGEGHQDRAATRRPR